MSTEYSFKEVEEVRSVDSIKQQLAKEKGITLLIVPCWWDGKEDRLVMLSNIIGISFLSTQKTEQQLLCVPTHSLISTIKRARPDLLQNYSMEGKEPIPEEPPPHFFDKMEAVVPDIGPPMTASFFTLSHVNPINW